jgi:hypothetical protein
VFGFTFYGGFGDYDAWRTRIPEYEMTDEEEHRYYGDCPPWSGCTICWDEADMHEQDCWVYDGLNCNCRFHT